jgi:oligopeptide transport system substrate-binding protein
VFHLREGLTWSDGQPLTAHDVEFGIKRVLNPMRPALRSRSTSCLEQRQDYYLRRHGRRATRSAVRALDDRTVEFRWRAPAVTS